MFEIQNRDNVWRQVKGALQWDWRTGYIDPDSDMPDVSRAPSSRVKVWPGNGADFWNLNSDTIFGQEWSDEYAFNLGVGFEAKVMGAGVEVEATYGFSEGTSHSIEWTDSTFFEGQISGLPYGSTPADKGFTYSPYMYVARSVSANGVEQAFLVCDYIVPYIGPRNASPEWSDAPLADALIARRCARRAHHHLPVSSRSGHLVREQRADLYLGAAGRRYGDRRGLRAGTSMTSRAPSRADGVRVRHHDGHLPQGAGWTALLPSARPGPDGQWGETAHRQVRVDSKPPVVKIALDPASAHRQRRLVS